MDNGDNNNTIKSRHPRFKASAVALCVSALLASSSVLANQTVWQEDFEAASIDQKGITFNTLNMDEVTKWSIDVSAASLTATSDWFRVQNGNFEGRDLDGIAVWQSESIDISSLSDLSLVVNVSEGGSHESNDFIDIAYSLDGGAFITVPNWQNNGDGNHTLIDDFTSASITVALESASSLQVKVSMHNGAGSEYLRLADVTVISGSGGGDTGGGDTGGGDTGGGDTGGGDTGGGDTGSGDTISGACFNCPDLTKIADAALFNDSDYYFSVSEAINTGQSATQIKEALNNAISANHNKLSYSEVWTALTQTDEDPINSNNVILLYKGISLAKMSNGSGTQSSNPDNWNREHVWAKSHGFPSSSTHAYTDIHHLRPTDISVNSSRGNLDFDLSDSPLGEAPLNRVDGDSFEPRDAVKGDVARMVMYMDTRYQGLDGSTPDLQVVDRLTTTGEAKLGKLCVLLDWHTADPVDTFEQTRNARAYEFQGNRNPFIDHPEWAEVVFDASQCGTGGGDTGGGDTGGGDTGGGDTGGGDTGGGNTGDSSIIISEYIEGSGYNKAIELYNTSNTTVDLSDYALKLFTNGSTQVNTTLNLTGTINPFDVVVIGHSSADPDLKSAIDIFSGVANFNGDDYVELLKADNIVDGIGTFGIRTNWGKDVTLVRKPNVLVGDSDNSDSFIVADEWISEAQNNFTFVGAHTSDAGNGGTDPIDPPPPVLGQCGDMAEKIHVIQGTGASSPLVETEQTIEGVVSSVIPGLSGYFVQEEVTDQDNDVNTSEGIFVYHNGISQYPTVGNVVRVKGTVKEFYSRTQLSVTQNYLDCAETATVSSATISLPVNASAEFEALEGMLVNSTQVLSVTNTHDLFKYGQFVVSNGRLIKPTNIFAANSSQALALADKNARNKLMIDDMNSSTYPATIPFPAPTLSHNNTIRLGDGVDNLTGILDFSYGNYKVLPTLPVSVLANNPRTIASSLSTDGSLKVASFNVLNYFNGPSFPTARGADTATEFERQSHKIVAALAAIDADVVGLMEIENDGYGSDSAIAELVNRLNAVVGAGTYQYVSLALPSLGSDAIAVGMIYKPASVALKGSAVTTITPPFDYGNRQPLAQTFVETSSGEEFTLVVNHFKSKGSCGSASGANADQGDGQGCWNELRTQAANSLVSWLATAPTGTTDSDVMIIGDLNAYGKEDPINTLTNQGYKNLVSTYGGVGAYTYAFGGEIGYLDHALANNDLALQVVDTKVWHTNADEPNALDYNVEKKSSQQLNDFYGNDAYRASDHDPIVVSLALQSAQVLYGDLDLDGDIDINDVRAFSAQLRAGQSFDLNYDFNNDGVVNSSDVRALMSKCTRARCAV